MRCRSITPIVTAIMALSSSVFAYDVVEMPLEEKVAHSDVVVIGRANEAVSDSVNGYSIQWTRVRVEAILKGRPAVTIMVLTDGPDAEDLPNCCKPDERYLFFLRKTPNGNYATANGPFGIYPIGPTAAVRSLVDPE